MWERAQAGSELMCNRCRPRTNAAGAAPAPPKTKIYNIPAFRPRAFIPFLSDHEIIESVKSGRECRDSAVPMSGAAHARGEAPLIGNCHIYKTFVGTSGELG